MEQKTKRQIREERKRMKQEEMDNKEWVRDGHMIRHHITNKCNGGTSEDSNLLLFDRARERAWHFLFGNKSFEEVAELLLRVCRAKKRN